MQYQPNTDVIVTIVCKHVYSMANSMANRVLYGKRVYTSVINIAYLNLNPIFNILNAIRRNIDFWPIKTLNFGNLALLLS